MSQVLEDALLHLLCHLLHTSVSAAAEVTDGQCPLLFCLRAGLPGQNYAVYNPSWVVMTEYGSVCSPCCFQGQSFQAKEKKEKLSCISSLMEARDLEMNGGHWSWWHRDNLNPSGLNIRDSKWKIAKREPIDSNTNRKLKSLCLTS